MDLNQPIQLDALSDTDTALLKKAGIRSLSDAILAAPDELAKKYRIPPLEMRRAVERALDTAPTYSLRRISSLEDLDEDFGAMFSTGDAPLDQALNGGVRTGHVTEIAGESAAGKTGLALQISLFVQLPIEEGGIAGSTCYLTTKSRLETRRLHQILATNDLLSDENCSLEDVHTMAIPNIPALQHSLEHVVPEFVESTRANRRKKPVRLIIIDALAELFHDRGTTSSSVLIQRAKDIATISAHLHQLAQRYDVAIVVLNEVVDATDRLNQEDNPNPFNYNVQSRLFASMDGLQPGENRKEAALGLSWANQVNTRIMLSRTGRRRYLEEDSLHKRPRVGTETGTGDPQMANRTPHDNQSAAERDSVLIRRLAILFSSVCSPASFDYIVTESGITLLPGDRPPADPQPDKSIPIVSASTELPSTVRNPIKDNDLVLPANNLPPTDPGPDLEVLPSSCPQEEEEIDYRTDWVQLGHTFGDANWDEIEFNLTQSVPS